MRHQRALTLIELLVVLTIVGLLTSLMLPVVSRVRESSRRVECRNHLHQIALAIQGYATVHENYPPGSVFSLHGAWSVHGRILPHLDESTLADAIHYDRPWDDPVNVQTQIPSSDIPTFHCPSDPHAKSSHRDEDEGGKIILPTNYGVNFGTWFVFDPVTRRGGDGVFYPDSQLGPHSITDGLAHTLGVAEVRSYQPIFLNTQDPGAQAPSAPSALSQWAGAAQFLLGPQWDDNAGHTEWCDAPVHESGFTTTFAPNTHVAYTHTDGMNYDVDYSSRYEGKSATQKTYAAITARSYHAGSVNTAFLDGSVRSIDDGIDLRLWRAWSTRAGRDDAL